MRKCCVCKKSRQDAILYYFPRSDIRRNKWLKCLDQDNLKKLSTEELSKLSVCENHFESRFITLKSRLKCNAYPSLITENEILTGSPTQENIENIDPLADHGYSLKRHFDHSYCKRLPNDAVSSGFSALQCTPGTPSNTSDAVTSGFSALHCTPGTSSNTSDAVTPGFSALHCTPGTSGNTSDFKKERKVSRKRIVKNVKDLSPLCRMVYKEYRRAKQLANFHKRAQRALKFNRTRAFEQLTEKMNPYAKKLINMQINLCCKKKKGYRFTQEEKLISLSILKQSPKCYNFLQKIFILPSRTTLNKMVAKLKTKTGVNQQVFNLLKKEVAEWSEKKKYCSIIFDEMSLDTGLHYDKKEDSINGFVDLNQKNNNYADHALVFMLRGAIYKWQQPIAYYFCEGTTSGLQLKQILKDVVSAVVGSGLKPIALICDQGAAFQSAIKKIKEETDRSLLQKNQEPDGRVIISDVPLNIIYDPSHLIKGLRNNFLNKNIMLDGKTSKWSDIVDVYETDCYHAEARLLHKLNDQHVIPEKIKKMKVKNCVKVFSKTVSAALYYTSKFSHYADGRPVSSTIKNTAEIVNFFDELFDSVNGATTYCTKGKKLRTAVTQTSAHHEFWKEAIKKLEKIRYIDIKSGREKSVPSLKNFIVTLKSYMRLWQFFKNQEIKIMRPRYFNSDPIENFFGQVRAYNYRSNDPNCHSFNCTFKSLLITRIIKFHNYTFNCEDDPAEQAINLSLLFKETEKNVEPGHSKKNIEMIVEQARRERINVHSRAYAAGWVVRKILNKLKITCDSCKNSLTSNKSNIHDWISCREYNSTKKSLNYPSEGAVRCFGAIVTETNEFLERNPHINKLSFEIKNIILSKHSFNFINCTEHKDVILNHFLSCIIRFSIINWCSIINKILKGTDTLRLSNRQNLPAMQKKALEKYKKKLKNKCFNK